MGGDREMKAVLVLDEMPNDCEHCEVMANFEEDCARCSVTYDPIRNGYAKKRCPLKEMPKKRGKMFLTERSQNDTDLMVKSAFANCYTDGWNDCLEEIER
jgi:hypothetical protein